MSSKKKSKESKGSKGSKGSEGSTLEEATFYDDDIYDDNTNYIGDKDFFEEIDRYQDKVEICLELLKEIRGFTNLYVLPIGKNLSLSHIEFLLDNF